MGRVRGTGWAAGAALAVIGMMLGAAPAALAAPGDEITSVTFPVQVFGVSIGVDCDGNVYYTGNGDNQLYKMDKAGNLLAQFTTFDDALNEPVQIDEITWDNSRGIFWGCQHNTSPTRIYRIDPTNGKAVFAFDSQSFSIGTFRDGIAYDASDDSLWISGDVSTTIEHHACSDGSFLGSLTPLNDAGGALGSISGVAVGTGDTLYLGRNGFVQIVRVRKSDGVFIDVFTSPSGVRDEGLECDPINFAPAVALWSRELSPALAGVYELEAGSCGCGGAAAPTGACCSDDVEGGCQNGVTEAQCAERSGGWGGVGSSCATIASQDTDGDGINDCDDRPGAPQEQPEDFVTDFKTNTGQGNPCADCGKMDPLWFLLGLSGYTCLLFVRRWKR